MTKSKEQLKNIIKIASCLDWTEEDKLHEYYIRMTMEHIFTTLIIDILKSKDKNNRNTLEKDLPRELNEKLNELEKKSKITIPNKNGLVSLYTKYFFLVEPNKRKRPDTSSSNCEWLLGCTATDNKTFQTNLLSDKKFVEFVSLEDDHVLPHSKATTDNNLKGKKICRHHNAKWKTNHLALGLPIETFSTKK